MRYTAADSRNLTDDGVRKLVASYTGRYAAVIPDFKMRKGFIYTQVRAISARINQNYDAWPSEELKKSFRTFLGKPVFVNHQNFDPTKARGRVIAARYRESGDDKYIEVIQEIDANRFPKLAKEIHEGGLDSVSMGVEAGFTKCSICDNKATDISDMCSHVKHHKGETLRHAKTGEPTLVYEKCLTPDVGILMEGGVTKRIADVVVGDRVIDHLGQPRLVTETHSRMVNEDILSLVTHADHSSPLTMTRNHPVLAIRAQDFGKESHVRTGRLDRGLRPEFIEAGDLREGDWVCRPRLEPCESLRKIRVSDYVAAAGEVEGIVGLADLNTESDELFYPAHLYQGQWKHRERQPWIRRHCHNPSCDAVMELRPSDRHRMFHSAQCWGEMRRGKNVSNRYGNVDRHPFPDTLELTEEFGRFVGWFLSEGSTDTDASQVDFGLHRDEEGQAQDIIRLAESVFGLTSVTNKVRGNGRRVTVHSAKLARLMNNFGVGADNKALPEEFMSAPIEFLRGVVAGHELGDGLHSADHVQKHGHKHFTCSPKLAEQIYTIHVMLGNTPYRNVRSYRGYEYPGKNPSVWRDLHTVGFGSTQRRRGQMVYGPWTFARIKAISTTPYSGSVHNLEVADTHTYVANGISTHNCYKLGFFELSYVFDPADETAVVSRVVVANKTGSAATDIDWADLGRQAYENGESPYPEDNPEVAEILESLAPEEAEFVLSRYEQGYEMAEQNSSQRFAAATDEEDEKTISTMQNMTPGDMAGMPSAPTSYNLTPGEGWVNPDGSGGGSSSSSSSSGGGGGDPGGVGAGGIMDVSRPLYEQLKSLDPNADIGGYREDSYGEHSRGALDYMTTDPEVAAQVRQMGFDAGAPHVIWQQQLWYPDGSVEPMEDRGDPTQNHMDHVHIGPLASRRASRRLAWGEDEAPEDIDTLRDETDEEDEAFHHYVKSPEELRTPDFDKAKRLDRAQENAGLDTDRRVEDVEAVGIPTRKGGSRMFRRYAEGPQGDPSLGGIDPAMLGGDPSMGGGDPSMMGIDPSMSGGEAGGLPNPAEGGSMSPEEELALLNEAQGDLEYAESELYGAPPQGDPSMGGGDPSMDPSMMGGDPSMGDIDPAMLAQMLGGDPSMGGGGDPSMMGADPNSIPPQMVQANRWGGSPVKNASSQNKGRRTQKGRSVGINLSERGRVASRGRRFVADDDGHVDGGPYGRNDQGEQEDIFLSQTPGEEAVATPEAGDSISNTERNLVARVQRGSSQLRRDAAALAYLRQQKRASRRYAENEPSVVNPDLSGTDDQSLKGDDFDSVALDNVSTQPKDASIHAFAAFDDWLARTTGKTARQHGNANYIRRQAARYIRATGVPLGNLFPTLEKVLVQARKAEAITANRRADMKRHADTSLEVAAPGDRIDVEAPVKNVTDADAQASQYALSDYAGNASDGLADPDLSTDSQFWAPGEGTKSANNKTADAVAAVRCAEAYINAGLAPASEKWKLIARFQTMRHATVVDRTRLLEAKNEVDRSAVSRSRTAAVSRGASIPQGLGGGQRTAQTQRIAANDPGSDSLLFF